jgi:hypothetical protein
LYACDYADMSDILRDQIRLQPIHESQLSQNPNPYLPHQQKAIATATLFSLLLATNRFTLCKRRRRPSSMHKKERTSFSRTHARHTGIGLKRIHEKKMRPAGRILTYMLFVSKYYQYFCVNSV